MFPAGLSRPGTSRVVPVQDYPGMGLTDFFGPGTSNDPDLKSYIESTAEVIIYFVIVKF